jgi:hypothetical protein
MEPHSVRRTQWDIKGRPRCRWRRRGDEVATSLSSMPLAYSLDHIPWPCPPGKGPRTPLVTHLPNGKPCWFTFSQLRHFLRLVCYCCLVPLSFTSVEPTLEERELLGAASPCGAGLLLRSLSAFTSSGASQLTEYLSFEHSNAVWLR